MGGFKHAAHGSGLWRFDGSSWQHFGAEWMCPINLSRILVSIGMASCGS